MWPEHIQNKSQRFAANLKGQYQNFNTYKFWFGTNNVVFHQNVQYSFHL